MRKVILALSFGVALAGCVSFSSSSPDPPPSNTVIVPAR